MRNAEASDVEFMRAMLVEAAYPLAAIKPPAATALAYAPTAAYLEGWRKPGDAGVVAVDGGSGERVGAAWYRLFDTEHPGYGFVDAETPELTIAVAEGWRGKGIGTALLRALLDRARADGFAALSLSVSPDNPAAELYRRHGFVHVGSRDVHWTMLARLEPDDEIVLFRYANALLDRFPSVVGGVVHAQCVTNGTSPPDLARAFAEEQGRVVEQLGDRPLSELPGLAAWRRAFSAFGVEPTKYRSAAEALLRRLTKHGDIPSINLLVDLGNLVSIRYGMPVAVFDQRAVTGGTVVRFAEGSERFTDLGSDTAVNPAPGEVIFVDDAGLVSARRWCWRQSAESAARDDTTEVLVTVEGHHEDAAEDVAAAVADLVALLEAHARPDALVAGILDPDAPSFNTARKAAGHAPGS